MKFFVLIAPHPSYQHEKQGKNFLARFEYHEGATTIQEQIRHVSGNKFT